MLNPKLLTIIACVFLLCPVSAIGQNIDTKHLSLQLDFDWNLKQAFGTAEITASVLLESQKIYLDAGNLVIQTIELNKNHLHFTYDGGDSDNNVEVVLDRIYQPDETFTVKIEYHTTYVNQSDPLAIGGSFGKGLRFLQPTAVTPIKRKQIWSSGEPENNKYWFPCNEDIADIHTTEIKAKVEKPLILISNGTLVGVTESSNQTRLFHYQSETPFPNYLVSIVVGEYKEVVLKNNATTIRMYGYPDEKEAATATVELLPDMMQFLEDKTGHPHPFKQYTQVVVQDYPYPGLVGQHSATLLSDNYIDDFGVHEDFKYLWDGVAVQALANQWFGNLIMPKSWKDIWLNNAFAQYFAGLYTGKSNGKEEYLTYYFPWEKMNVLGDWDAGSRHPIVQETITGLTAFTTDSYSKFRGALVLRMLQYELGDDTWWKAVHLFVKSSAGRQVSTRDFQNAVERVSGKKFDWFFEQWIYKCGLPEIEVKQHYSALNQEVTLLVRQIASEEKCSEHPQLGFAEGKIAVEIDGRTESVYLKPQPENTFSFPVAKGPGFVNFNMEDRFLCKTTFEKTTEQYFAQLQNSKDILARQKAIDYLVTVALDSSATTALKNQIIRTFQAEFRSQTYWRYRWYVLGALQKLITPPFNEETITFLTETINMEKSWIKTTAISILGKTQDSTHKNIYITALTDKSDRVINSASIALGKTKSAEAFEVLMNLENQPSWKNQNRISALNGLQQLGDPRAVPYILSCLEDNQSPRWFLATPVWDYPFAAATALEALGRAGLGFPVLFERFKKSLAEGDINDVFQLVQLINILKDERAKDMYLLLKGKYQADKTILEAVAFYENQYSEMIRK